MSTVPKLRISRISNAPNLEWALFSADMPQAVIVTRMEASEYHRLSKQCVNDLAAGVREILAQGEKQLSQHLADLADL